MSMMPKFDKPTLALARKEILAGGFPRDIRLPGLAAAQLLEDYAKAYHSGERRVALTVEAIKHIAAEAGASPGEIEVAGGHHVTANLVAARNVKITPEALRTMQGYLGPEGKGATFGLQ